MHVDAFPLFTNRWLAAFEFLQQLTYLRFHMITAMHMAAHAHALHVAFKILICQRYAAAWIVNDVPGGGARGPLSYVHAEGNLRRKCAPCTPGPAAPALARQIDDLGLRGAGMHEFDRMQESCSVAFFRIACERHESHSRKLQIFCNLMRRLKGPKSTMVLAPSRSVFN